MTDSDLLNYIMSGREHLSIAILESWIKGCKRFKEFTEFYRKKIRAKFRKATNEEELEDIRCELEIPYLFLSDIRFAVEYEKYKFTKSPSPDFTIIFEQSVSFNVEVKRIRESESAYMFNYLIDDISKRIEKIPSSVAFSISVDTVDVCADIVKRLKSSKEDVIKFIENTIRTEDSKLSYNTVKEYSIPNFKDELILDLSKPLHKIDYSETSYNGGLSPIFYTQKEKFKFGDVIFEKLGQMIPDMINVIIINTNSSTHEGEDLLESISSINELIRHEDEQFFLRKEFQGIEDFLNQSKWLSGILFRSNWVSVNGTKYRNLLWCNEQAEHQIPAPIKDYLKRMDKEAFMG